jgi:ferrous iron transport protein A
VKFYHKKGTMKLSELKKGEKGVILSYGDNELSLKLMEMGFIIGEHVAVMETGFFNDPMAFKINGYLVSLRRSEAETIMIDKITN